MNDDTFEVRIGDMVITAYANIRGDELVRGDMYIAKRNTGWQLGKCCRVYLEPGANYVMSDPPGKLYSYNCNECYKVKDIKALPNF